MTIHEISERKSVKNRTNHSDIVHLVVYSNYRFCGAGTRSLGTLKVADDENNVFSTFKWNFQPA